MGSGWLASNMAIDPVNREGLEQLLRRSCREVEIRVRAGEDRVSEAILETNPALAVDAEMAIDIIYTEYVTREELGQKPTSEELSTRFPQWSSRLERLLDVDAALGEVKPAALTIQPKSTWEGDPKAITTHGPNPPPVIRKRIGGYEILQEIGRGGMGVVYRARQLGLNRIVALKVIQAANVSPGQQSRFRAEAVAIAQLAHPNIVRVIEIGEQDDDHFISLEYAAEGSLDRKLLSGPFAIRAAAEVVETLARAVDYAHEMGIIHRDLKPGNVLISADGVVKVADFGLAKWYLAPTSEQTQSGALLGTPCYMAPEQAGGRAHQIGPATDIYALGVILYELLIGSPPFMSDSTFETLENIRMQEPPSLRRLRRAVPRDLETICLRCLQKDPRRRFLSARDLAGDLHRFLEHEPIKSRSIRSYEKCWRWLRRHAVISSLTTAMLVMALVGIFFVIQHRMEVDDLSSNVVLSTQRVKLSERIAATAKSEAQATIDQTTELVDRLSREGLDMMWRPGLSDIGQQSLDRVLVYYQDLLKKVPNDSRLGQRAANAYVIVGQFQRERGKVVTGEKNIRQGVELWTRLSQTHPNDLEIKAGLARGLVQLAVLDSARDRADQAEIHYREAVKILDDLIDRAPTDHSHKHRLSNALLNLAVPLRRRGKLVAAEQAVRRAVGLMWDGIERAIEKAGKDKSGKTPVKSLVPREGLVATGDSKSAKTSRKLPPTVFLRQLPPTVLKVVLREGWVTQLGLGYEDLALAWERLGYIEDAERGFQQAFEIRQLAVIHGGPRIDHLEFLARSHWTLSRTEFRHGRPLDAESHLRESIDLLTGLEKDYPSWTAFSNSIAASQTLLGKSLRLRGLLDESEDTLRQAVSRYEKQYPGKQVSAYTRFGVSEARRELALTLHEQGRFNESMMLIKQACFGEVLNMHAAYDLAFCLSLAPDFKYRNTIGIFAIADKSLKASTRMRAELLEAGTPSTLRRSIRGSDTDRSIQAVLAWKLNRPVQSLELLAQILRSVKHKLKLSRPAPTTAESVLPTDCDTPMDE